MQVSDENVFRKVKVKQIQNSNIMKFTPIVIVLEHDI